MKPFPVFLLRPYPYPQAWPQKASGVFSLAWSWGHEDLPAEISKNSWDPLSAGRQLFP